MDIVTLAMAKKYTDDVATAINGGTGIKGEKGDDGFSPVAKVEKTDEGAKITITDKTGTTTAEIKDGANKSAVIKLWTDGSDIYRTSDYSQQPLTFDEIYDLCYDTTNYVYIGDGQNKFYPSLDLTTKDVEAIVFTSTYQIQGRNTTSRIIINANDEVSIDEIANLPMPMVGHPTVGQIVRAKTYDADKNVFTMEWAELPSKTSELTNDSGFLTLADLPIYGGEIE